MTTNQITSLNSKLEGTKGAKLLATNNHVEALKEGINLIKDSFDSIAEVKKLTTQRFLNGISKKMKLVDQKLNDDMKRVLKISHKLICGYIVRKELLTISQIEQLVSFDKKIVNDLMDEEDEEMYKVLVKELINEGKKEVITKTFSVKKAKEYTK